MNFLYNYKNTILSFTNYLVKHGYPAKDILTRDFTSNIGVILEYLSSQHIYCLVDCYNIIVYTDGGTDRAIRYIQRTNKVLIIKETDNEIRRDVIHNYMLAIKSAFEFLNTPF